MVTCLPMGMTALEGGKSGELDAGGGGGGVGGAKRLGKMRVRRLFCIHGLAHRKTKTKTQVKDSWLPMNVAKEHPLLTSK